MATRLPLSFFFLLNIKNKNYDDLGKIQASFYFLAHFHCPYFHIKESYIIFKQIYRKGALYINFIITFPCFKVSPPLKVGDPELPDPCLLSEDRGLKLRVTQDSRKGLAGHI